MVYMALAEYNRLNAMGIKYVKNVGRPETEFSRNYSMIRKPKEHLATISGFFRKTSGFWFISEDAGNQCIIGGCS